MMKNFVNILCARSAKRSARIVLWLCAVFCAPEALTAATGAADLKLQSGDLVAIIGDSITEQKQYSLFIEEYLLMCQPAQNLRTVQFGWGGETAGGFLRRMDNDMIPFKATVATTCYGMNDGGYSPMNEGKASNYRNAQTEIVEKMKKAGVRTIIVGSPGVVDADTFRKGDPNAPAMYNKTLAEERDIARDVAQKQGVIFANVYDAMMEAMTKAKAKYGKEYAVAGGDGVHPDKNGHLVMAYAFLKAMGCDGNIGTITVDVAGNSAEASDGHKVLSAKDGKVQVQSTRYPFCFFGNPEASGSTSGIIEFIPFNQELNRLTLVVHNLGADKAKVTWGGTSKEFSEADLSKGINLAAEFIKDNPFSKAFQEVEHKMGDQQNLETMFIKGLMHAFPEYQKMVPEESESFGRIQTALMNKLKSAREASAGAVAPVTHVIQIEVAH